jgi:hypothetical protein
MRLQPHQLSVVETTPKLAFRKSEVPQIRVAKIRSGKVCFPKVGPSEIGPTKVDK